MRFLLALLLFAGTCSAQVLINVGTVANDGTGDTLRLALGKANTNFTTAFLNIITGSNLVGTVAGNLTTVSNNVGTVAANLTTVSNQVVVDIANLTTVSNRVNIDIANLTTVSNSVVVNTANLTTVSNSVTAVTATAAPLLPASASAGGLLQFDGTNWVTLPRGPNAYFLRAGATTNTWYPQSLPVQIGFMTISDAAVSNSTNETTILGSVNTGNKNLGTAMNAFGRTTRFKVRGMVSNYTGSPTLTIRFKLSGTNYLSTVMTMSNATDNDFEIEILVVTRSTGSGGTISTSGSFSYSTTAGGVNRSPLVFAGTQVVDLTTSKTVDVTAQWSVAHSSNSIVGQIGTAEFLGP